MGEQKTSTPSPASEARSHLTVKVLMAKARAITKDIEESQALAAIEAEDSAWSTLAAVQAPYDPESLLNYIELTPHVKPAIAALAHNVDGYGYRWDSGRNWTLITALAASGQGVVPPQYNLVRVDITVGGALGAGTDLIISGKVL